MKQSILYGIIRTMKNSKIWPKLRQWLILLPVLVMAGIILVSPASAQESPLLTVVVEPVKVRSGPDATYPDFETLKVDDIRGIIGYNAENGWWQIVSKFGTPGWVDGDEAYISVNEAALQQFVSPEIEPITAVTPAPAVGIIVFQASTGGPIYAINQDGTNLRYLTTGIDPALSPDGQWVAFTRWETSQDGALGSVWLINVDGTGERVIHEYVYNPRTPAWSADGTQLAISMQHGGHATEYYKCSGDRPPREAYNVITDPDPDDPRDVEYCYTLPPDPHWGLRLINVATGQYEDLPGDNYSLSPSWDPNNSQHLVFDGDIGLSILDLEKDTFWEITESNLNNFMPINDHSPVYSPDGSKIALTHRQSNHWEIHVLNADGSGRAQLTGTPYITWVQQMFNGEEFYSYNNASPAWSPDGSQLAFLTDRTGQWEIWVMNADGTGQQPLFPAGTLDGIPLQYNGMDEQMIAWR